MNLHTARFARKLAGGLVTVAAAAAAAFGQYGRFSIAEEPSGARASAMGSAGTALAGGEFGCYNPASPAFADAPFFTMEFGKVPGDLSRSQFETAWMFSRWFAGTSLRVHSTDWQTANEQGPGEMSSNQMMQATIAGGFTWGKLASGHSFVFFHERIGDQSVRAFTYSPGFVYQLVPRRVTLGASLLHYLRLDTLGNPKYTTLAAWRRGAVGMPRYARAGAAWSDTIRRAGMPFTVAADLVYSDVYDLVMAPIGAELWILPYLAVRAGTRIRHPTDIVHFGVGLRWSTLVVDFDYGVTKLLESADPEPKWLLGFTYALPHRLGRKAATREPPPPRPAIRTEPPAPETVSPVQEAPVQPATVPSDSLETPVPGAGPDSLLHRTVPDSAAPVHSDTDSLRTGPAESTAAKPSAPGSDSTSVGPLTPAAVQNRRDTIPAILPPGGMQ